MDQADDLDYFMDAFVNCVRAQRSLMTGDQADYNGYIIGKSLAHRACWTKLMQIIMIVEYF